MVAVDLLYLEYARTGFSLWDCPFVSIAKPRTSPSRILIPWKTAGYSQVHASATPVRLDYAALTVRFMLRC